MLIAEISELFFFRKVPFIWLQKIIMGNGVVYYTQRVNLPRNEIRIFQIPSAADIGLASAGILPGTLDIIQN
ncbi:MAG: hypothetical protein ABIR24_08640 [Verrucomicrobiota bacterium]